jgi:hypothetical protein
MQASAYANAWERDWYRNRNAVLKDVNQRMAAGMSAFRSGELSAAESAFDEALDKADSDANYELLDDGQWAYRCDDVTRQYALAAYYHAIIYADPWMSKDQPSSERARSDFCLALRVRPDLIMPMAKHLSTRARSVFDLVLNEPGCYIEDGWRTRARPDHDALYRLFEQ